MAKKFIIVLSTDNVDNNFKICIIQIKLEIMIIYISCLYNFYFNWYNKYNFLMLLADIAKNSITIYII